MSINYEKIKEIVTEQDLLTDQEKLYEKYCKPDIEGNNITPKAAIFCKNADEISRLVKYFRSLKSINIIVESSTTSLKFLGDTSVKKDTVVFDLSKMKEVSFVDKRNRVCVVEPGVTWAELASKLKQHGLRPLAPLLPRPGKSALASVLDREPHLIPKKQFDISDPLLCMEVVFGNGEIFRTGEAAGPLTIQENRKAGAALTNPLGPGQTDIFRIIQGSKGTFGCVTWVSMQCDLIPEKRVVKFIESSNVELIVEFVYKAVRKRLIDEVFVINDNLFNAIFSTKTGESQKFILVYAINGYELLPDEKISYQTADIDDILKELGLRAQDAVACIDQKDWEPILDGNSVNPHPKYSDKKIAIDVFYNTTLDRVGNHYQVIQEILKKWSFPLKRFNFYLQPVIQARAANVELSLLADKSDSQDEDNCFSIEKSKKLAKQIAQDLTEHGAFFSRSYSLINDIAFSSRNDVLQQSLKKLKGIFDPDGILNKGQLVF